MTEDTFTLHHVSVLVGDTETALGFYRDVLGLVVSAERPALRYPGAWLAAGDGQIHLIELPNPDPVEGRPEHVGNDRHLALGVANLDAVRGRLEAAGIPFTLSKSGRAALFCRDPDGNGVELIGRN